MLRAFRLTETDSALRVLVKHTTLRQEAAWDVFLEWFSEEIYAWTLTAVPQQLTVAAAVVCLGLCWTVPATAGCRNPAEL